MRTAIPDPLACPFLPLWTDNPDELSVGRLLLLGRSSTYEAARRGEIPTVKIGRREVVPTAALLRLAQIEEV